MCVPLQRCSRSSPFLFLRVGDLKCLCRLTSCVCVVLPLSSQHAILHTRLCFSSRPPGDPHSCARTLPGSTRQGLLDLRSAPIPGPSSDQSANFYFWPKPSLVQGFGANPPSWTLRVDGTCDAIGVRQVNWPYTSPVLYPGFLAPVRAALPFEHPSPSSPFFETVPKTPGGGKKLRQGKRSRGVVHGSYNARHTTGLETVGLLHQKSTLTCTTCREPSGCG